MKRGKYFVVLLVLLTNIWAMMGIVYGAPKVETKEWPISFLGTLKVPAQLEIVDGKDMIIEVMKLANKMEKTHPSKIKKSNQRVVSPEEMAAAFDENKIGFYELALKNHGSYNTAMVFAGKIPEEMNAAGGEFFEQMKTTDQQQQEELHKIILKGMGDFYAKAPDMKDIFQLEILEFYPFKQITTRRAQIISIGGSMAVRTFKLIQPVAFKIYFIKKSSDLYVFGVINSGPDRKMWDDMSKEMLRSAVWNLI